MWTDNPPSKRRKRPRKSPVARFRPQMQTIRRPQLVEGETCLNPSFHSCRSPGSTKSSMSMPASTTSLSVCSTGPVGIGLRRVPQDRHLGLQLNRKLWSKSLGRTVPKESAEIQSQTQTIDDSTGLSVSSSPEIETNLPILSDLELSQRNTSFDMNSSLSSEDPSTFCSDLSDDTMDQISSNEAVNSSQKKVENNNGDEIVTDKSFASDLSRPTPDSATVDASDNHAVDPSDINFTMSREESMPTIYSSCQKDLIDFLTTKKKWAAFTSRDFAKHQRISLNEDNLELHELSKLDKLLDIYVVSPCTKIQRPEDMSAEFRLLSSQVDMGNHYSVFSFLSRSWDKVQPSHGLTSFGAELDTGPWMQLCKLLGAEWVSFLVGYCRIYRPYNPNSKYTAPEKWLDSTLSTRWHIYYMRDEITNKLYPPRIQRPPKFSSVSKQSIMYHRRLPHARLNIASEPPLSGSRAYIYYGPLVSIAHKRLRSYFELSSKAQKKVPKSIKSATKSDNSREWTPIKTVSDFVNGLSRRFLPTRILGSKCNHRAFYRAIHNYLKTPGYLQSSIASFTKGIKMTEIPWLKSLPSETQQEALMGCLEWIIHNIIHPTLAHHFYITEISGKASTIFYFEQSIWKSRFEAPGRQYLKHLLESETNKVINLREQNKDADTVTDESRTTFRSSTQNHLAQNAININSSTSSPVSSLSSTNALSSTNPSSGTDNTATGQHVRYVPKPDGSIRPIINLKTCNKNLRAAQQILHHMLPPSRTRSSSWHNWAVNSYNFRQRHANTEGFYVVKADISGCYDNANIEVVKQSAMKLSENGCDVYKSQGIRALNVRTESLKDKQTAIKLPESPAQSLCRDSANETVQGSSTEIIGEFSNAQFVHGSEVSSAIDAFFSNLFSRISKNESIMFNQGIPQGSSISSELCNILLDDLVENESSSFVNDPNSMSSRYVDDFLFVTTEKDVAEAYFRRMKEGFQVPYGSWCNPAKIVTNFAGNCRHIIKFLGSDIRADTLEVVPRPVEPFNMKSNGPADKRDIMKHRSNIDMMKFTDISRSFHRCGISPTPELLHATALKFGLAMAERMPYYVMVYAEYRAAARYRQFMQETAETSETQRPKKVSDRMVSTSKSFYQLINRYFAAFVPSEERARSSYRVIRKRYYQEREKLRRHQGLFVELKWRKQRVQKSLNLQ